MEYSICSARLGCGAALEREYSWEYASAWLKARLMARLGLNGLNMARGYVWSNSSESSGGACGSPRAPIKLMFAPVSSYG